MNLKKETQLRKMLKQRLFFWEKIYKIDKLPRKVTCTWRNK